MVFRYEEMAETIHCVKERDRFDVADTAQDKLPQALFCACAFACIQPSPSASTPGRVRRRASHEFSEIRDFAAAC
jgi:hypothetical protein